MTRPPREQTDRTTPDETRAEHAGSAAGSNRLSRRTLLVGAAGITGLGIGSAGTAAGLQITSADAKLVAATPPSEDLMSEHGVLKRILLVYREAGRRIHAGETVPARAIHDSARIIHDFIEGFHEGLEEAYVFARLRGAGHLVDTGTVLLVQHARGRDVTADILAATGPDSRLTDPGRRRLETAMDAFVRMYEVHEAREDTVVFPVFRAITPDRTFTELGERFADEQRRQFGAHSFTDMVDRVTAIEQILGIYDLHQFTPPAG